jgi:hypothetical protein
MFQNYLKAFGKARLSKPQTVFVQLFIGEHSFFDKQET